MPRYDVVLILTQEHHMAVEANSIEEAHAKATAEMGDREPEKWHIETSVEKGVRG